MNYYIVYDLFWQFLQWQYFWQIQLGLVKHTYIKFLRKQLEQRNIYDRMDSAEERYGKFK